MNFAYFSFTRVLAAVACIAGIILLWPANLFFLNDDFRHIYLTQQSRWLQQQSFRPLCDLSMWIDYQLYHLNAVGYHVTNALLHIACTIVLYRFAKHLFVRYHQQAIASSNALLVAVVFFVFAFHAETIYWVIGRSGSLGALFGLLSLSAFMNRQVLRDRVLAIIYFVLGLLAYESTWVLPILFILFAAWDVRERRSSWKQEASLLVTSAIVLLLLLLVRYLYIGQVIAPYEGEKFLQADITGLSKNFIKLVLRCFSRQSGDFYFIGITFLLGLSAVMSALMSHYRRWVLLIVVMWLGALLPYLSLGIDTFGSEGERYLYFPSVFFCILLGIGISNARHSYRYVVSLLFIVVHILFLFRNKQEYITASAITRSTTHEMKLLPPRQRIFFQQLPQENNGALIFRDGIDAALKLFAPQHGKAVVITTYDGNYSFFNGTSVQDWMDGLPGEAGTDAVFDFTGSTLTVYR